MMRKAYYGMSALFMLGVHTVLFILEWARLFPYSRTFFFPIFCLIPLLIAAVGLKEKDRTKWPAWLALGYAAGMILYWGIALGMRLSAQ